MLKLIKTTSFLLLLVMMLGHASASYAQNEVRGTVSDDKGEPLPGATIQVKGKQLGVSSDADGRFAISAAPGDILLVSYVGYDPETVRISSGKNIYDIRMREVSSLLDDLVVVGYGVQKKVNLTGAVSSVDYAKEAASRPIATTAQALSGASSGLNVLQTSGQPGNEDILLRIRGVGTLNDASPLVIIDGFEGNLGSVNPDDIESISILKDAASCAIYGNRGANGVILITTKKAKDEQFTLSYSGLLSVNEPANHFQLVSNYARYMEIMNESAENVDANMPFSQSMIDLWREKSRNPDEISDSGYPNYVAYPNTDWMDAMFKKGQIFQRHNLSASGRKGGTNYLISFSYVDNPGIVDNTSYNKFQLRANITSRINKYVELGAKLWGYQSKRELTDFSGASGYMSRGVPCIYPYHDGKYGWMENPEQSSNSRNNLYFINRLEGHEKNSYINASLFTNIFLPLDITGHISFNYSRNDVEYKKSTKALNAYSFRTDQWAYFYQDLTKLSLNEKNTFSYRWTFEGDLSWNRTFGDKHDVSAMVGFEAQYFNRHLLDATKTGLINNSLTEMDVVTTMSGIGGNQTDFSSASVFGRATYAYDSRYLLEVNLRYDGSSRFARESRWGLFPSVSAGWRISQEDFMQSAASWLSNLKLRASWGKLGNNSIDNYAYQAIYNTGYGYVFGNTQQAGMVSTMSNNLLEWETTTSFDVGLDAGFLNNRLTVEADWYHRLTDGILYRAPLHLTAGVKNPPYQNLCEVTNQGVELTVGWKDRIRNVSYGVSANFTRNYNEVSKYRGRLEAGWVTDENGRRVYKTNIGEVATTGTVRRTMEGKLINEYFLLNTYSGSGTYYFADGSVNPNGGPVDGMIRTEADMKWLAAMINAGNTFLPNKSIGKKNIWYGDYIYADTNGDGVFGDENDYTFQGSSMTPKFYYGLSANLNWKGIDFSMQWAGAGGFSMYWRYLGYNCSSTRSDTAIPLHIADDHYFFNPEDPADPRTNLTSRNGRLTMNYGSEQNGGSNYSTLWLYKADYLKLKNVTIGYTLPKKILKKIRLKDLRVFVSGENLACFTKYPGMDPEFNSTSNYYASLRQWSFGLNLKF